MISMLTTDGCGTHAEWSNTGLTLDYPPVGATPYSMPADVCGVGQSCRYRLIFVDPLVTPTASLVPTATGVTQSATGFNITLDAPTNGSSTNTAPVFTGTCTDGAGTSRSRCRAPPPARAPARAPGGTYAITATCSWRRARQHRRGRPAMATATSVSTTFTV